MCSKSSRLEEEWNRRRIAQQRRLNVVNSFKSLICLWYAFSLISALLQLTTRGA